VGRNGSRGYHCLLASLLASVGHHSDHSDHIDRNRALLVAVPKCQVSGLSISDAKARGDLEDSFRKTITQLLGGLVVLAGVGFTYWQFRQQQRNNQALLFSNQISKGFQQLGSKEIPVRLGGIYALEGVMNASTEYHRPVLEALCAFVRRRRATGERRASGAQSARKGVRCWVRAHPI
jgi:hypothetical protein